MKHDAKARGSRLDLSLAELRSLVGLAERGARPGAHVDADLVEGLRRAYAAQEAKAEEVRRAAVERRASRPQPLDKSRNVSLTIDGFDVGAELDDYVDASRSPDFVSWAKLSTAGLMSVDTTQAEVRRNVWRVRVRNPDWLDDNVPYFLGCEVTETADRAEVEPLARRIIARAAVDA